MEVTLPNISQLLIFTPHIKSSKNKVLLLIYLR